MMLITDDFVSISPFHLDRFSDLPGLVSFFRRNITADISLITVLTAAEGLIAPCIGQLHPFDLEALSPKCQETQSSMSTVP